MTTKISELPVTQKLGNTGATPDATRSWDFAYTWNNAGTTFVGMFLNITSTASAAGSLIADWQVGSVSQFSVGKTGVVTLATAGSYGWSDTFLTRRGAASIQHGAADAAAPVAQKIAFQGSRGGTDTNTAGVDVTYQGSLGTGTAASGKHIFSNGFPAASGTTQHTAVNSLTIGQYDGASGYGQVWLGNLTPSNTNYALLGTNNDTRINSSSTIDFYNGGSNWISRFTLSKTVHSSGLVIGWASGTSASSTNDTGLYRNAAAIVEVNNGTAGTFGQIVVAGTQGNTTVKALTESSATTFVKVTVASGSRVSGNIEYSIEANDATDFQVRGGIVPFVAVNKAGTITATIGTVGTATEVVAVSTGTLTNTFTVADAGSNVLNILANAASSLTQTTLQIKYRVNIIGTATVTPQ